MSNRFRSFEHCKKTLSRPLFFVFCRKNDSLCVGKVLLIASFDISLQHAYCSIFIATSQASAPLMSARNLGSTSSTVQRCFPQSPASTHQMKTPSSHEKAVLRQRFDPTTSLLEQPKCLCAVLRYSDDDVQGLPSGVIDGLFWVVSAHAVDWRFDARGWNVRLWVGYTNRHHCSQVCRVLLPRSFERFAEILVIQIGVRRQARQWVPQEHE